MFWLGSVSQTVPMPQVECQFVSSWAVDEHTTKHSAIMNRQTPSYRTPCREDTHFTANVDNRNHESSSSTTVNKLVPVNVVAVFSFCSDCWSVEEQQFVDLREFRNFEHWRRCRLFHVEGVSTSSTTAATVTATTVMPETTTKTPGTTWACWYD